MSMGGFMSRAAASIVVAALAIGCNHGDCDDGTQSDAKCHGAPTPCSERNAFDCESETIYLGCQQTCGGSPADCYTFSDSFDCEQQDGCYWSASGSFCGGAVSSCSGLAGVACGAQDGCTLSGCSGDAPTPCSALGQYECSAQPGCYWY